MSRKVEHLMPDRSAAIESVDGADYRKHIGKSIEHTPSADLMSPSRVQAESAQLCRGDIEVTGSFADMELKSRAENATSARPYGDTKFENASTPTRFPIEAASSPESAQETRARPQANTFKEYLREQIFRKLKEENINEMEPYFERLSSMEVTGTLVDDILDQISIKTLSSSSNDSPLSKDFVASVIDLLSDHLKRDQILDAEEKKNLLKRLKIESAWAKYRREYLNDAWDAIKNLKSFVDPEDLAGVYSLEQEILRHMIERVTNINIHDKDSEGMVSKVSAFLSKLYENGFVEQANQTSSAILLRILEETRNSYVQHESEISRQFSRSQKSSRSEMAEQESATDRPELGHYNVIALSISRDYALQRIEIVDKILFTIQTLMSVSATITTREEKHVTSMKAHARDRVFMLEPGVMEEVVQRRSSLLSTCAGYFRHWTNIMIGLEVWESAKAAFLLACQFDQEYGMLDPYCRSVFEETLHSTAPPILQTIHAKEWRVIGSHIAARLRDWKWFHVWTGLESPNQGLDPYYNFLYHLSIAELEYFNHRNLAATVHNCHQALDYDLSESISDRALKEDALQLLALALHRQGFSIDAEYRFSLISEDYDSWRLYGEVGKTMKKFGFSIRKWELLSDQKFGFAHCIHLIAGTEFSRGWQILFPINIPTQLELEVLLKGLFTDDVSWQSEPNILKYGGLNISDAYKGIGSPLHLFVALYSRKPHLLTTALENPWINIDVSTGNDNASPLSYVFQLSGTYRLSFFRNSPPLVHCAELTQILLAHGANPNASDSHGRTPLHHFFNQSCLDKHCTVVPDAGKALKLLLDFDASLTTTDYLSQTPLHCLTNTVEKLWRTWDREKDMLGYDCENFQISAARLWYMLTVILKYRADEFQRVMDAPDKHQNLAFRPSAYLNIYRSLKKLSRSLGIPDPEPIPTELARLEIMKDKKYQQLLRDDRKPKSIWNRLKGS